MKYFIYMLIPSIAVLIFDSCLYYNSLITARKLCNQVKTFKSVEEYRTEHLKITKKYQKQLFISHLFLMSIQSIGFLLITSTKYKPFELLLCISVLFGYPAFSWIISKLIILLTRKKIVLENLSE